MSNITEQLRQVTANINDKMAATTQFTMEKMGNRSNTTEPQEMRAKHQRVESLRLHLKDIYKRITKIGKLSQVGIEEGKLLAEAFRQTEDYADDPLLFNCLKKISEFQSVMEDLRSGLNQLLTSQISVPMEQFVKSDIREARYAKKKFDRVRLTYETSVNALKNVSKKQKVNLNKVLEAEERRNETKKQFEFIGDETMEMIDLALDKNSFLMLETLGLFVDSYKIYFDHGSEMLKNMQVIVEESRSAIAERKKNYEEQLALHQLNNLKRKEKIDRAKILSSRGKVVFGISLNDIKERDNALYPPVIDQMIRAILRQDLNVEGIFRVSPSKTLMDEVKEKIDTGKTVDFSTLSDRHIAPGLLKSFLRDLPEPLLTFNLYEQWTQLAEFHFHHVFIERAKYLLSELPEANRKLFMEIMSMCNDITKHSDKNLMTAKSLSIVLTPNLLYQRAEHLDPKDMVSQMAAANESVAMLIEHFQEIVDSSAVELSTITRRQSASFSAGSGTPIGTRRASVSKGPQVPKLALSVPVSDSLSLSPRSRAMISPRALMSVPSIEKLPPPPPPPPMPPGAWVKTSIKPSSKKKTELQRAISTKRNHPSDEPLSPPDLEKSSLSLSCPIQRSPSKLTSDSSSSSSSSSTSSSGAVIDLDSLGLFVPTGPPPPIPSDAPLPTSGSVDSLSTRKDKKPSAAAGGGWTLARLASNDSSPPSRKVPATRRRGFDSLNTPAGYSPSSSSSSSMSQSTGLTLGNSSSSSSSSSAMLSIVSPRSKSPSHASSSSDAVVGSAPSHSFLQSQLYSSSLNKTDPDLLRRSAGAGDIKESELDELAKQIDDLNFD